MTAANEPRWARRSGFAVVATGCDADFGADDLVHQLVLIGDPSGPVTGDVVLQRSRFPQALVAVASDVDKQRVDALEDLAVLCLDPARHPGGKVARHLGPADDSMAS